MATNWNELVTELVTVSTAAHEAKSADTAAPEVRAAKVATTLSNIVTADDFPIAPSAEVVDYLSALRAFGPTTYPRDRGDYLSSRLSRQVDAFDVDADDVSAAFAKVVDDARAAVTAWNDTAPSRKSRGDGNGGDSAQSFTPDGIASVSITAAMPDGAVKSYNASSSWSNAVYFGVTERVKSITDGKTLRDYPTAHAAWKSAMSAIRGGNMGPHTFTVDTGDTGTIAVEVTATALATSDTAEVAA